MKDRIREVRRTVGMTQAEFAKHISIGQQSVTAYENGLRQPSNAVIASICREFNVSEMWLRKGEGEMFLPKTMEDTLSELFDEVAGEREDSFRKQVFLGMARLDAKDWAVIAQLVRKMLGKDTEEK